MNATTLTEQARSPGATKETTMPDNQFIDGLNSLIADASVFYQKLRHYHWNVHGDQFFKLHEKFEELYDSWATRIDDVAERVLTIGGEPIHTLSAVLEHASLKEDADLPDAPTMVKRTVIDLEKINGRVAELAEMAEDTGDRGSVNLLDDMRQGLEKDIWMLKAFLNE